ncbi:MAG: trimethylamine methyltransferase family protein [Thermodesulfobacteriota bacterium]
MKLIGLPGGQYRPLTNEQILKLHQAGLDILEHIGFTYEAGLEEIMAALARAGAKVDKDRARVFFPPEMVMELAAKAPSAFTLYGREGRPDIELAGERVYLGTGGAAVKILDLETGEARSSTLRDIYQLGRLVDQLENIHFFMRPCVPTELPVEAYDINNYFACLKATGKHVMTGVVDVAGFHQALDLAGQLAGGLEALKARPIISIVSCYAISPLKFCTQSTLNLLEAVKYGVPAALSAAPMAGLTSPLTMAGTLAQLHAEQLAGIALCQIYAPGAPVLYGGIPGTANMRSMSYQGGVIEFGMMNAAIAQLAHFIKVPNYNSSGLSDSKIPDAQAGWEKGASTLLAAMGGSNFIHHAAGMLESMLAVAYEQYVLDDEIIGASCKVLKGIEVDDEHLALDVIAEVGPGGNFIMTEHTIKHMKSEYFQGNGVSDRKIRDKWVRDGALDAWRRARVLVKQILAREEKSYLPAEVERDIRVKYRIYL